jgi:acetyltransferase-like isoleucine patch superfamily enzyme
MILRKIKNAIVYILRYLHQKVVFSLFKLSSKNINYPSNTVIKSFKSIKTTDDGKIIVGKNTHIENGAFLYSQKGEIIIGDNVYIGSGTQIIAKEKIIIGNDCQIASYCIIRDTNHGIKKGLLIRNQADSIDPIKIGNDVWIGSHVSIIAGSAIADGAVIGTHAVVNKNIPKNAIAVGIPAKVIKYRS